MVPKSPPLKILVASWNVGNAMPPKQASKIHDWIPEGGGEFDVIVVGLQESSYREKSSSCDVGPEDTGILSSRTSSMTMTPLSPDADTLDPNDSRSSPRTRSRTGDWESENDDQGDAGSDCDGDAGDADAGDADAVASENEGELDAALATARRLARESSMASASSPRKQSLSQQIDGDDITLDHEQGSGPSTDSGVARAPLAAGDVIVKRSRTKKSIRRVSKLVRQVSANLRDSVAEVLDYPFNRQLYLHLGDKFALVGKVELMEMRLFMYVQTKHSVTGIEKATVPTGLGSVLGNKGGLIFKMVVQNTSLCFVSCHLAAHQDQKFLDKRNSDCASILGTNFAMKKVSLDHQFDHCFWFGDLNYRVDLNYIKPRERSSEQHFAEVLACVRAKKWALLNNNDQLKHQIEEKKALSGWELPPALFPPTFKRIRHAPDEYNPQRIPSYCDRVLHKSLPGRRAHLKLQRFTCIESISSSDHKPVRAEFHVTPTPPISLNTTLSTAQATRVEIVELCALDLIGMDMTGLSDPYIKFYSVPQHALQVEPSGSHPTTTTIMNTLSPVWRDAQVPKLYVQCVEEKDVKLVHLILLFMDYDTTSADDVLGVTTLSLDKYCLARPRFVPFDVPIVRYGKAAGSVSGKIRVTMPHQADMVRADSASSYPQRSIATCHCSVS
uniref:C2 domain-containing protein n=1 Tax=Globisporangium ultimum (strain ATCC 200006 / CBS 805.95 / DAOM BR144) TaxID=431595 RepID=K3X4F6_GLOUD